MMNHLKKRLRTAGNKQKGLSILEIVIVAALIIGFVMFILSKVPQAKFSIKMYMFNSDTASIIAAVNNWKNGRPDFSTVKIGDLCTDGYLNNGICGTTKAGAATTVASNPFAGTWSVTGKTTTPNTFTITATVDTVSYGRFVNQIADKMAPQTAANCASSSGCSTIAMVANKSVAMTY